MKDVGNDKVTFKFYDTLKLDCLFLYWYELLVRDIPLWKVLPRRHNW